MTITAATKWALKVGDVPISYAAFDADIDACTNWLRNALAESDHGVAVSIRHPYWHWVATLALLRLGRSCASIFQPQTLPSELRSRFDVWLTDAPLSWDGRMLILPVETIQTQGQEATSTNDKAGETKPALRVQVAKGAKRLVLTSGTTGTPKIISIDGPQLQARLQSALKHYGADVSAYTRLVSLMGIDTIGGLLITMATWMRGGCVLLGLPTPDGHGSREIAFLESNLISASPARLQELLTRTRGIWPGRKERIIRVGGSRLHRSVRDAALARIGCRVQTTYGSTELGLVASCDAQLLDQYPGAAGYVLAGARVEIVDRNDGALPPGKPGLIRCQAPGMATGYDGAESSTAFRGGWFYSGDIGILHQDGMLVVTGRDTDVLNLGGLKLSAVELETALLNIAGLNDVCVVALDEQGTHRLAIAVVHSDDVELEAVRPQITQALPQPMQFHLIRVPWLPRNAMGKLPRTVIAQKLLKILAGAAGEGVGRTSVTI